MRNILFFLISLLIGIVLFIWIYNTIGWEEIKNAFLVFTGWEGLVIFSLTLSIILIGNWKWKEILKGEGFKVSFFNLLRSYLASFSIMFFAPILFLAGEIFRGYVLKEKNAIPFAKGTASVVIDRILEWTANLAVIFFGILFFLYKIGFPSKNSAIIFGIIFPLFVLGATFFYLKVFRGESIIKSFLRILGLRKLNHEESLFEVEKEIFNFFKIKNISMWKGFLISALREFVMYLRVWFLIFFLGKEISGFSAFSILGFSYLATIIPIPASLGSHEAIQVFAFKSLGLGVSTATAFTMIIRGAELIIALVGLAILFRLGFVLLKDNFSKKFEKLTQE